MSHQVSWSKACFALLLLGCSGGQSAVSMPGPPAESTEANLVGPLCKASSCQCSDDPLEAGEAPEGLKRFQIELGPSESLLWAKMDEQVFYKGIERARECFYIDLPAGEHHITLRAKGEAGFGAGFSVREIGGEGPWYYDSFDFQCGAPGLCDKDSLSEWKEQTAQMTAGKHAPCGSVRISGIDWITGKMPDNIHPADFYLQASMKVYDFAPYQAPGTDGCIKDKK